jgi:hypothetical protein
VGKKKPEFLIAALTRSFDSEHSGAEYFRKHEDLVQGWIAQLDVRLKF